MCICIVTLNDLHMINFWGDLKTKFISKSWLVALTAVLVFVAS